MKNLIKIALLLFFINSNAQVIVGINTLNQGDNSNKYFKDLDNNFQNFVGTWENTTNGTTFRVILWKEEMKPLQTVANSYIDDLFGRFQIIQYNNLMEEIIIHDSVKYFPQNGSTSIWSLIGNPITPNKYGAYLMDTCANGGDGVLEGKVLMEITNLGSTPLTAHWTVKSVRRHLDSGEYFSVPTDIILTKVE